MLIGPGRPGGAMGVEIYISSLRHVEDLESYLFGESVIGEIARDSSEQNLPKYTFRDSPTEERIERIGSSGVVAPNGMA